MLESPTPGTYTLPTEFVSVKTASPRKNMISFGIGR